jgi:predicted RNA-binding Zn-ribbon protein involved in translation (DUF1610 family)
VLLIKKEVNFMKDEYDFIYGEDDGIDYAHLDENESPEEVIARLKEELGKGPCPRCGEVEMVPDEKGYCYYCLKCGFADEANLYLRELAGYPTEEVDE